MSSKSNTNNHVNRQSVVCSVIGAPYENNGNILPSYSDVMKHYLCVWQELKLLNDNKDPSFKDVSDQVVTYLENLWKCASLPSVGNKRIYDMLKNYHQKYMKIKRQIQT